MPFPLGFLRFLGIQTGKRKQKKKKKRMGFSSDELAKMTKLTLGLSLRVGSCPRNNGANEHQESDVLKRKANGVFGRHFFVNFLGDYEEQQGKPREGGLIFSAFLGYEEEFSERFLEIKQRERAENGRERERREKSKGRCLFY